MELSRKRKPLGPRQRLAYIKPFIAAVAAAKAKVAGEFAALEAAKTAWSKALRRWAPAIVRTDAAGGRHEVDALSSASIYGLAGALKTDGRTKVRKRVLAGEWGVTLGNGSPKPANLVKRIRLMSGADVRKRARLLARLAAAQKAVDDHVVEAFTKGTPLTPEQLADSLIGLAAAKPSYGYVDSYAVTRAAASLEEARKHDGTMTCPCAPCSQARQMAEHVKARAERDKKAAKAEVKRLAKLGKVTFTCPQCEHVNEHSQVDEDEGYVRGELVIAKIVECEECETAFPLAEISTPPAPGQQSLVAA